MSTFISTDQGRVVLYLSAPTVHGVLKISDGDWHFFKRLPCTNTEELPQPPHDVPNAQEITVGVV